jgi:hypothetical protein
MNSQLNSLLVNGYTEDRMRFAAEARLARECRSQSPQFASLRRRLPRLSFSRAARV